MNTFSSLIFSLSQHPKALVSPTIPTFTLENTNTISRTNFHTKTPPRTKHSRIVVRESSLSTTIFNTIDDFINTFVDPPLHPSVDPKYVLSDNYAPVDELPPTECEVVEGSLPPELDGAYIRNGSNPQFFPRGPYHLFDGDGMIHCIKIHQGKATLCSRYVKTNKYIVEHEAGSPVYPNIFSGFNGLIASASRIALSTARVITGQFNPSNGIGVANTSLALFGGNLFALAESDLPYIIKVDPDGDVITLGRHDFDGKLVMNMTAHPKIDSETGEAFAFRYSPIPPFLIFFRVSPNGKKHPDVPIFSMTRPSLSHDFAITKKYAIFADIQIELNPIEMIRGGSLMGADPAKVPRLGVIPLYAKDESEMRWFEVPGLNILHSVNAWDEDNGNIIAMVAPNILNIEHFFDRMELIYPSMEMIKINLKTGIIWRQPLSTRNLDLAVINPAYTGKKNKYFYAATGDPLPKANGVVKVDASISKDRRECVVACKLYEPGCYGGEPFFVAKETNNSSPNEEDDGYLMTYVHNEITGESSFLVMDAKSHNLEIVAVVKLPRRVPYGFHGLFVRENDLNML